MATTLLPQQERRRTNLCSYCQHLELSLFRQENDGQNLPLHGPELLLRPYAVMRRFAQQGCELCTILTANSQCNDLPFWALNFQPIRLRRAMISSDQAVTAYIGLDDISTTYFSRIPSPWSKFGTKKRQTHLYGAKTFVPQDESQSYSLGQPNDDLQLMRTWMEVCSREHPQCEVLRRDDPPSRLLDVRAFAHQDDIRLVDTESIGGTIPNFVCLSHCWGSSPFQPSRTTKDTIAQNRERISFASLSNTFKDAIRLTKQMGQRYLWIDSLCILQDDAHDWATEAPKMPGIYGRSILTLAALSSADGRGGCRTSHDRDSKLSVSRRLDISRGAEHVRFFENKPKYWYEEYGDNPYKHAQFGMNPLRTRAWALQERELSTRCIHFSGRMLLWQCRTMKGSSELPWTELEPLDDFAPWPVRDKPSESSEYGGTVPQRARWYDIIEDYSSRFATRETDKLPAIAGMASEISQSLRECRYFAGLFEAHMPSTLLWMVRPKHSDDETTIYSAFYPRRPMTYRGPSWSWASIDGAITFNSQRLSNTGGPMPAALDAGLDFDSFQLLQANIQLCGHDPFGLVEGGSLQIRGRISWIDFRYAPPMNDATNIPWENGMRLLMSDEGTAAGVCFPDVLTEMQFETRIACLEIQKELYESELSPPFELYQKDWSSQEEWQDADLVMGLALRPVKGRKDVYQRRGLVRWLQRKVFSNVKPSELTLI